MHKMYQNLKIANLEIKNRFVRSATWEGCATTDGYVTERLLQIYDDLAKGGVGLIITGHLYVSPVGQASDFQLGIHNDDCIMSLQLLTEKIHSNDVKIFAQISHSGIYAYDEIKEKSISISSNVYFDEKKSRIVDESDIEEVISMFVEAGKRAKKANFDGIEIHAAHGYFISQTLSPVYNTRDDEYGGSLENRSLILYKIIKSLKVELGYDYPVIIKINCSDFEENGLTVEDTIYIINKLYDVGLDGVEISGGLLYSRKNSPTRRSIKDSKHEAYFSEYSKQIKENVDIPVMLVGGLRSGRVIKKMLDNDYCDFVSMSRPFICEPDFVNKMYKKEIKKSRCVSCNKCFRYAAKGIGLVCVLNK